MALLSTIVFLFTIHIINSIYNNQAFLNGNNRRNSMIYSVPNIFSSSSKKPQPTIWHAAMKIKEERKNDDDEQSVSDM